MHRSETAWPRRSAQWAPQISIRGSPTSSGSKPGSRNFIGDMDEETIPLEAGIESRAISLTKGCYVGQEVIIRVLHRGHGRVARKLVGLSLDEGIAPLTGTPVDVGGREIGHTTSSCFSPALHRPIALAYLHRDFLEPGTRVSVDGVGATVAALPFVALQHAPGTRPT